MKKICVIIPTLHGAGCEKLLSELLPEFVKIYNVDLLLYEKAIDYKIPQEVNIFELGTDNSPKHGVLFKIYRLLKRVINIGRHLKRNEYDSIISFIDGCNINVAIACALYGIDIPIIHAEHTVNENFFKYNKYSTNFSIILKKLLKWTYSRKCTLIVISESMKKYLIKDIQVTNLNIEIIYNGIKCNNFNPIDNEDQRGDLDSLRTYKSPVFINVARLDDNKNQELLIRSFHSFIQANKDGTLFIVGKGENRDKILELTKELNIENKVKLIGWTESVRDYLIQADIFVLSSKYEGFPVSIIEAISCGIPVITSNSNESLHEIISERKFGIVLNEFTSETFNNAVEYFMDNKPDKHELHNHIKVNFNLADTSLKYIRVIDCSMN